MAEQACPRCKTTSYRNPNLKLLVNVCGHKLCQTCVDVLFTRPSAACPECNTPLRRSDFRIQQFEDAFVEREVDVRKRIIKIFNKRETDFAEFQDPLRHYNDYLEEIETIIFNLANKVDVEETKRKVEKYKKENEAAIRKINAKLLQEDEKVKFQLAVETKEAEERRKMLLQEEQEQKKAKCKEKDALIDDLIHANASADEVLARHHVTTQRQQKEAEEKKSMFFTGKSKSINTNLKQMPVVNAPLYKYKALVYDSKGPEPPGLEDICATGYLDHIRPATAAEKAAGYTEIMACDRALKEAFNGLFL
eukprot:gene475-1120_t